MGRRFFFHGHASRSHASFSSGELSGNVRRYFVDLLFKSRRNVTCLSEKVLHMFVKFHLSKALVKRSGK